MLRFPLPSVAEPRAGSAPAGPVPAGPRVVPLDIGFLPEAAVSAAVLLQDEVRAVLTFAAVRVDANGRRHAAGHAVVELEGCTVTRFGYPNDEALAGHPLASRGLGAYGVHEVLDSEWPEELARQNRVAFPETPRSTARHFVFTFHDATLECVASGLRAALSDRPYPEVFAAVARRVLGERLGRDAAGPAPRR